MTLVSTGALSLGFNGTSVTPKDSIANEVVVPASSSFSLAEYRARVLAQKFTDPISIADFYGASSDTTPTWALQVQGTAAVGFNGADVDSSGNIYVAGYMSEGAGSTDHYIIKVDQYGTVLWQKQAGSTGTEYTKDIAVDASGNCYTVGDSTNAYGIHVLKYNTNGTLQWARTIATGGIPYGYGVGLDSSANVYICGTATGPYVAKYSTSGTLQWQRKLGTVGGFEGIAVSPAGNVYVTGYTTVGSTNGVLVAKYNISGTLQWQRTLNSTADVDTGREIVIDASENCYICGGTVVSGSDWNILTVKIDTNGNLLWQRALGNVSTYQEGWGISIDSSGNVYSLGHDTYDAIIAKYDSAGVLQWQRYFSDAATLSSSTLINYGNYFHIVGRLAYSPNQGFIARRRSDGLGNGSVNSLSQTVTTFTESAAGLTYATSSITGSTPSYTSSTLVPTQNTKVLARLKTNI